VTGDLIPRDEAEEWLMEKPVAWAQVVAARAALRILPQVLNASTPRQWLDTHAMHLLRASAIIWILRSTSSFDEKLESRVFGARAAADAAFIVRAAARSADKEFRQVSLAADSIANATDASRADAYAEFATRAAAAAISEASQFEFVSQSVILDREWMTANAIAPQANFELLPDLLNQQPIWLPSLMSATDDSIKIQAPDNISHSYPDWFGEKWQESRELLLSIDKGFEVWCLWYDSLINGNSYAFSSIPKVEKSIKIRILDADDFFWGQDSTIINRSIRQWIDEASLEHEIEQFVLKIPQNYNFEFGSDIEKKARKSLSDYLATLAKTDDQMRGVMGHNMPPESMDSKIDDLVPSLIRSEASAAANALSEANPDVTQIIDRVSLISRALQKLGTMAGLAADKFAEAFGTALGASAGIAMISVATLASTGLLEKLMFWLNSIL
jgi:hypothetical protein